MADKMAQLRRYGRKDYSEVVTFPVEIVGRDGGMRWYGFPDAVKLYQRRITYAPVRYGDGDLALAEQAHCRARVNQLRHSYFHQYGWGTVQGEPEAQQNFGRFSGEVAAFLCGFSGTNERLDVRFRLLREEEGVQVWHVALRTDASTKPGSPPAERQHLMLSLFQFDQHAGCRDRFFQSLRDFEGWLGTGSSDLEHLLAFHHAADCGLMLTGAMDSYRPHPRRRFERTEWSVANDMIMAGDHLSAVRRLEALIETQPYHRSALVACSLLHNYLRSVESAQIVAQQGLILFPSDPGLGFHLGVALHRRGEHLCAMERFEQCLQQDASMHSARAGWLLAAMGGGLGTLKRAWRLGFRAPGETSARGRDARLGRLIAATSQSLRRSVWMSAVGVLLGVMGLGLLLLWTAWGFVLLVPAVGAVLSGVMEGFRAQARLVRSFEGEELTRGMRYVRSKLREATSPPIC